MESTPRRSVIASIAVAAAVISSGLVGWWVWRERGRTVTVARGQQLFEQNCALCHGVNGDGRGKAASLLLPKPRNLRAGKFRLVSSQNLEPTREDLFRTLTNGMPDTPMPSWAHLAESDRWQLADYVLKLNWQGWVDIGLRSGDTRKAAEKYATETVEPGKPILVPPEPPATAEGLKQGRQYYITACSKCHGQNGEGKRDPTWRTSEGFPTWSRNFKRGVFKGGREGKELYLRFSVGMPGTPMPSSKLSPEGVWQVVHYVLSLSEPAAQERAEIRAKEIAAARVQSLPSDPEDSAWNTAPEVRVPLMPLWWHDGYMDAVRVKALHDGQLLAFRLEWNDPTEDIEGVRQQTFPDGAAVQLSASSSPPLFAMGTPGQPVNIWHWKALWSEDRKQFHDAGTAFPRTVSDAYYGAERGWQAAPTEDSNFLPAVKAHNLIAVPRRPSVVENANAAGFGTYTPQGIVGQDVQGKARWKDGVWRLEMTRSLRGTSAGDATLHSGGPASVAFAIWDGSAGDRNGQKSVSIWNTLVLK